MRRSTGTSLPAAAAAGLIGSELASGTIDLCKREYRRDIVINCLLDSALGRGTKHGYRFDYQPGPRDERGRINSYTICARLIDKALDPVSYFTDQTGVIRMTTEDRCPTAEDFAIAG